MIESEKLACVILNYNDAKNSLKYINFAKNLHFYDYIIVIDNNSSDDSFNRLLSVQRENVIVKKTPRNGGYGYGNNYGVKLAKNLNCTIAFISNPDVSYSITCAGRMVDFLKKNANYALVSPVQYNGYNKKRIKEPAWNLPTYISYIFSSLYILRRVFIKNLKIGTQKLQEVDCVPGAFLAIRIDSFLDVGGYDENIFLYCEESTLGFRLKERGYKTGLLTNERYYHFESSSISKSIPNKPSRMARVYESRMIYLRDYLQVHSLLLYFARVCFNVALVEEKMKALVRKVFSVFY